MKAGAMAERASSWARLELAMLAHGPTRTLPWSPYVETARGWRRGCSAVRPKRGCGDRLVL